MNEREKIRKKAKQKTGRATRTKYFKISKGASKSSLAVDPYLLLNYNQLGIGMEVPTYGTYFQMQGGMIIKRINPENPLEKEAFRSSPLQNIEAYYTTNFGFGEQSVQQRKQMKQPPKKSVYEIYNTGNKSIPGFSKKKTTSQAVKEKPLTRSNYMPPFKNERPLVLEKPVQSAIHKQFSDKAIMNRFQMEKIQEYTHNSYFFKKRAVDPYLIENQGSDHSIGQGGQNKFKLNTKLSPYMAAGHKHSEIRKHADTS